MADDPYSVLGVTRQASEDDIRRAFRKLAKENHPDVNPGNAAAAERFKKITAAYEIIGEPDRRGQFDRGEIDANGEQRRQTFHRRPGAAGTAGVGADDNMFGDIFSDFFASQRGRGGPPPKGQDLRYSLEADFLEAVNGTRKRVTLPGGGALDISIPEGTADGQVLRLKGKGSPSTFGGEPGDALVEVKVRPHPAFRRSGDNIEIDVPITIDEAVLGAKIEVPTISGRVQVTVPKASSSGKVLRLKGKGVRNAAAGTTGDQLVTLRIVLPDKIDETLAYFLSEWSEKHGYDPGRS